MTIPLSAAPRFLAPELGSAGDEIALPPDEAHHLAHVLRLGPGDDIVVFDGRGREFAARVTHVSRGTARATLRAAMEPAPEPAVPFSVVQALLKGSAMDSVVRDATMIGAARIESVTSAHVAVKASARASEQAVERWRRIALASAKQCRRATLPDIPAVRPLQDWLRNPRADLSIVLVEPATQAGAVAMRTLLERPAPRDVALLIGPEGGWSTNEVDLARATGAVPVTLGPLTLRADAMALAAGTLVRFLWDAT